MNICTEADIRKARERHLHFTVAQKHKHRGPWQTVSDDIEELEEAVSMAMSIEAPESCVFVKTRSGGFLYWTSTSRIFNSVVLDAPDPI